jgi:hypothetical protein
MRAGLLKGWHLNNFPTPFLSGIGKEANYFFEAFLAAAFFVAVLDLAGLVFPKLPANVFPFFVLMSPRPIV